MIKPRELIFVRLSNHSIEVECMREMYEGVWEGSLKDGRDKHPLHTLDQIYNELFVNMRVFTWHCLSIFFLSK